MSLAIALFSSRFQPAKSGTCACRPAAYVSATGSVSTRPSTTGENRGAPFTFVASDPLTFETGGYNAFITSIVETAVPSESYAAAWKAPVVSTDSQLDNLIGTQGDFSVEFWHSLPIIPTDAYHPFTYIASTSKPLVYYVDVDFENNFEVYLGINGTVMQAVTTPPVMSSGWRHFSLTYEQPYTILCKGSGFEVSQASNYNFNRDFSIAMTFSASDVNTTQGLLYKGTGSDNTSPELDMSYRVGISNGAVTLQLFDGSGNESPLFLGPTIQANQYSSGTLCNSEMSQVVDWLICHEHLGQNLQDTWTIKVFWNDKPVIVLKAIRPNLCKTLYENQSLTHIFHYEKAKFL